MVKNKNKNKPRKPRTGRKSPRLKRSLMTSDPRAVALARALADPCNAPLEPGCYPGQVGFISRFAQTFTITLGASDTAWLLAVTPGCGVNYVTAAATATTALTPTFVNSYVPGGAFMTSNARAIRSLGACIEFFTNQNALNATGTYYFGVAPHSAISNGVTSVGAAGALVQHMAKANAEAYEVKWRPGAFDEQYHRPNAAPGESEWDDLNAMIIAGTGFPNSVTLTVKVTIIAEWLPLSNLGLAMPAATNPSSARPSAVVAALDAQHHNWWAGKVGHAAGFIWQHGGKQLAQFASTTAAQQIARYATRALPMLL